MGKARQSSYSSTERAVTGADLKGPARSARLDLPVRDVGVPDLLAALTAVQETIRVADPRAVATEASTRNPRLLALFRQERRILRELKQRKALLSRGIGWTVLAAGG